MLGRNTSSQLSSPAKLGRSLGFPQFSVSWSLHTKTQAMVWMLALVPSASTHKQKCRFRGNARNQGSLGHRHWAYGLVSMAGVNNNPDPML